MRYRMVRDETHDPNEPWRATVEAYAYSLEQLRVVGGDDEVALVGSDFEEMLLWHWHPISAYTRPHLHGGRALVKASAAVSPKNHIASPRASFEDVVRTALDAGVRPLALDWDDRLALSETSFRLHRRWSYHPAESQRA